MANRLSRCRRWLFLAVALGLPRLLAQEPGLTVNLPSPWIVTTEVTTGVTTVRARLPDNSLLAQVIEIRPDGTSPWAFELPQFVQRLPLQLLAPNVTDVRTEALDWDGTPCFWLRVTYDPEGDHRGRPGLIRQLPVSPGVVEAITFATAEGLATITLLARADRLDPRVMQLLLASVETGIATPEVESVARLAFTRTAHAFQQREDGWWNRVIHAEP